VFGSSLSPALPAVLFLGRRGLAYERKIAYPGRVLAAVGTRELRQQVFSACRHGDSLSREIALGSMQRHAQVWWQDSVRGDSRPSTEANIMRKITGSMLRSRRVTTFAVVAI
jgi:hypothetical protein